MKKNKYKNLADIYIFDNIPYTKITSINLNEGENYFQSLQKFIIKIQKECKIQNLNRIKLDFKTENAFGYYDECVCEVIVDVYVRNYHVGVENA